MPRTPARLIKAAPDLLAACQYAIQFLDRLEHGVPEDDPLRALRKRFHAPLRKELCAAIEKALGERPW